MARNTVHRVEFENTTKREKARRKAIADAKREAARPRLVRGKEPSPEERHGVIRAVGNPVPSTLATALGAEVDPMETAKEGYRAIANREINDPLLSPGVARIIGTGLAGYQGLEAAGGAIGGGPRGNAAPRLPRVDSMGALSGANTPVYIVRGAPMSTLKYLTEPGETLRMPSFAVVADPKGASIAGGAGVDTGGLRIFMKPDYFLRPGTRAVLTKGDGWTEMGGGGADRPANMRLTDMLERLEKASHVNPDTFMAGGAENLVSRMYRHRRTPIFDEGPDGVLRTTGARLNTPAEAYRLARADLEAEFEAGRSAIQIAPKAKTVQNARRVAARERDEAQADAFRKAQTAEGVINPDVAQSGRIILSPEDKTPLVAPELLRQRDTNYHELKAYQDVDPSDIYAVALDVSAPGVTRASVEEAKRSLESKGLRVILYYPKTVDQYLATKGIKSKASADAFISDVMDLEHADTLDEQNAAFRRRYAPGGPNPRFPEAVDEETMTRLISRDIMFQEDAKGGDTPRNVRAAEGAGDTEGPETAVPETPAPEAPAPQGGPRIVLNPAVFHDKRDGLCVAMNEALRLAMEFNDFEPVSEPTEAQRKFFADTAYADDELQLRRTILARIATLDTSVKDPTDEQLEETAEMLEMVMEVGAPQNEWEQQAVKRLHDVVVKSLESTRANGSGNPAPGPREEGSVQAAEGAGTTADYKSRYLARSRYEQAVVKNLKPMLGPDGDSETAAQFLNGAVGKRARLFGSDVSANAPSARELLTRAMNYVPPAPAAKPAPPVSGVMARAKEAAGVARDLVGLYADSVTLDQRTLREGAGLVRPAGTDAEILTSEGEVVGPGGKARKATDADRRDVREVSREVDYDPTRGYTR